MRAITKQFLYALFALALCIVTVMCGWGNLSAYAATDESVQATYENTNVLNNLKGATIGGKEFDLKDYPHNSNGKPQVISFVEFCYSYYAEKQADYGLYIYVYNPQDIAFDMSSERNQIQFTYGDKPSYSKYVLEFLNYSTEAGYEGRFWKFKVKFSEAQRTAIIKELDANSRVYKISGIELSYKNTVTEYACGQTYTYKGYALGYGSELAASDTLSCKVDGFDRYLSLDVQSTYWRPQGTHSDGYTKDTIHSVYFSVPNKAISEYGEMTAVHATWLNAYTAPILITGNKDIYNVLNKYIGKYVYGGTTGGTCELKNPNNNIGYTIIATKAAEGLRDDVDMAPMAGYYAYNAYTNWTGMDNDNTASFDRFMYYLRYLFYADNGNADTYTLPAEKLIGDKKNGDKGWFETYTAAYGGTLINNRYSRDLFETVDSKFTDVTISSNDTYKLTDNTVSDTVWDRLFGNTLKAENSYEFSAIQKVTVNDISRLTDKSLFCDTYYVAESDYGDFTNYVRNAAAKEETVYLFRYYQSEYVSNEATEYKRVSKWALVGGNYNAYEYVDTNAFYCQMWVQLDFDIIDLTFTKDNVVTIIPVVMSPIDIAADGEHPASTQGEKGLQWWQMLLGLIALLIIFWLLLKFCPVVFVILGNVLLFPFKCIGALFKAISNGVKKRKERRKEKQEKEFESEKKRRRRAIERKQKESGELPDYVWTDDKKVKPKRKKKSAKPPELNGNVTPEEVDSYLDSIDWDSVDWSKLDGKGG